jgi:DNA ligase (NAD+)
LSKPSVDDSVFDNALNELIKLENEYPEFSDENSPTKKVGSSLSNTFEKKEHSFRSMLSLSNAFNFDDLVKFEDRIKKEIDIDEIEYSVEPKIDGISISLVYKNGHLIEALTRGDGKIGEVVTNNVKEINDIPKTIKNKEHINFRGEIYMPNSSFERINNERAKNSLNLFANPRNATSGTMRQLDSKIVKERGLSSFIYAAYTESGEFLSSQDLLLKELKQQGFSISELSKKVKGIKEVFKHIELIESTREELDYEIDGVVIKVNDSHLYEEIGYTTKFPK